MLKNFQTGVNTKTKKALVASALEDTRLLEECIELSENGDVTYDTKAFGKIPANVLPFDFAIPDFKLVCYACSQAFARPKEPVLLPCGHVFHNRYRAKIVSFGFSLTVVRLCPVFKKFARR